MDRTTVVELVIEPEDLFKIVEDWAVKSKFSVHKKSENRIVYCGKFAAGGKAWLSVERNGSQARLEVWQAASNLDPDRKGNFWRGWKQPVPKGIVLGPAAAWKKKYKTLIEMLKLKAEINTIREPDQQENLPQFTIKKSTLIKGMAWSGAIIFAGGLLGVINANSIINIYLPSFAETMFLDSAFDMLFGTLLFACSRVLSKGKFLAVWLYGGAILIASISDIVMGSKLNYILIGFGLLFIWQMVKLKEEWELA